MATFLVTARVSIFDEEAGTADQHNLALALPIRDRLLPMRSLHSQLQSISALSLNDPSKGLKSPVKIWGLPTLKYEGLDCRPEATIDYYRPLPSATSCLTAEIRAKYATSYPEDNRSMQVYVRGLSGQQKSIMCTQQMTVEQFKSKVEEAEGLPRQEQCLVYGGRLLSNLRTLGSYNISKGATIPLSARLRGGASINGIKFVDVSNPYNLTRIQWSNNAPEWRGAAPGLCIEGVCNNSTCKANGNLVIFNAGYTHFDLPYEVASDRCKCPTCKKSITPVTCALNRCEWKHAGVKVSAAGSRPVEVSTSSWQPAGDYYERFTHAAAQQVTWTRLMLIARESRKVFGNTELSTSSSSYSEDCVICCEEIASRFSSGVIHTPCGHPFHKQCLKPWMQLGNKNCPQCMEDISGIERHL